MTVEAEVRSQVGRPEGFLSIRKESAAAIALRQLVRNKGAMVGAVLIAVLAFSAVFAPLLAPHDPNKVDVLRRLEPPSLEHPLGTDAMGRDILSRVLFGGRLSLILGLVSVTIGASSGTVIGLVAGFYGGWIDTIIMRLVDVVMAIPRILLALVIAFTLGPNVINLMIAVGIGQVPSYIRLVRSTVLTAKEEVYVDAARVSGCKNGRILFRHILPNVMAPAVVLATLAMGWAVLNAATLSFLGMGVQPPTSEWGSMISQGRSRLGVAPWSSFFPGLAIMLSVLALNLLGDGLRDALDPRMRGKY